MGWLLVVVGLLLALLAVPIELAFELERRTGWHASLRLRWLFGLLDIPIRRAALRHAPKPKPKVRPVRKRPVRSSAARVGRLLASPDLWHQAIHLLSRLWHALRPRDLHLRATLGLDDPADTGRLWGLLGPGVAILIPPGTDIQLTPAFDGPLLELEASGRVRIILLQLLGIVTGLLLAPTTWRLLWRLRSA